ncbi:hypothetical protein ACHAXA_003436 [Cyclostephanos tholiformis]|uniref:Exonuclease 1 n=1 Tax=Cyclostephanos tholiformis TaxID=382380 RepID=A0ABD3SG70_9STRA
MGVKGLLPCLQSITRSVSLERYRGLTVAVDAMSWLHKGVFACDVRALAKSQRGDQSDKAKFAELKCIEYATNKAETLKVKFGIEVILVIDGDALPSKNEENTLRRDERDKAFEKAMDAEKAHDSRSARSFYAQSCSITHAMRYELIKKCKTIGLAYLVAPYEADAQMARLAHTGVVDLVITEDSDILVYGCPRALFKLDFTSYQGQEIQLMKDLGENSTPSFRNWTHDMFVFMCIISGCDYCKGVPGIGIKLAHKLVRIHRTPSKIFSALHAAGRMPPNFEEKFFIAFRTFRHQRVFCPLRKQVETLWPIDGSNGGSDGEWPFLGNYIEPHLARRIANGTLHPSKKIPWDEALKRHHDKGSLLSERNEMGSCRAELINKKSNIWYSLVYGPSDDNRRLDCEKIEGLQSDQQKRNIFSFFPKNKNQGAKRDAVEAKTKSPKSKPKSKYVPPAYHRDLPIHFNEYASQLVGGSFKPISRKRKRLENEGTKSAKYVQKIWEKCAEIRQVLPKINGSAAQYEQVREEPKGVTPFTKDLCPVMNTFGYEYEFENELSKEYYRDSNDGPYNGQETQQCDAFANLSFYRQTFDHTKQDWYLSARAYALNTHQLVETQNWCENDYQYATTSYMNSYPTVFEYQTHVNSPQSQSYSECVNPWTTFFNDAHEDKRNLLVDSFNDVTVSDDADQSFNWSDNIMYNHDKIW